MGSLVCALSSLRSPEMVQVRMVRAPPGTRACAGRRKRPGGGVSLDKS